MSKYLKTCKADIVFLAVAKPIKNFNGDKEIFTAKLRIDANTPEGLKLKQELLEINSAKVVTTSNSIELNDGEFLVSFNSKFQPKVLDENGTELKGMDIKFFNGKKDSGKAVITGKVDMGGKRGTVYLNTIQLFDMHYGVSDADELQLETSIAKEHSSITTK